MDIKAVNTYSSLKGKRMGYTTDFFGSFNISPTLNKEDKEFLTKFSETRRMKRNLGPVYGVEGEFYVEGTGFCGQDEDLSIINYNMPPSTQPSLWCQWVPSEDGTELQWNQGEKFYSYLEWMNYIVKNFIAPKGYKVNGEIEWRGEESDDFGKIFAKDNVITYSEGIKQLTEEKPIA